METLIEMAKRVAYFNDLELQVLLESYDEEKDNITRKGNTLPDRVNAYVSCQKHD